MDPLSFGRTHRAFPCLVPGSRSPARDATSCSARVREPPAPRHSRRAPGPSADASGRPNALRTLRAALRSRVAPIGSRGGAATASSPPRPGTARRRGPPRPGQLGRCDAALLPFRVLWPKQNDVNCALVAARRTTVASPTRAAADLRPCATQGSFLTRPRCIRRARRCQGTPSFVVPKPALWVPIEHNERSDDALRAPESGLAPWCRRRSRWQR